VTNQHDDGDTAHGIPGGEGLIFGIVGEFGSIKTLCFHTLVEAKVSDTDPKPSQEAHNRCQLGEIGKNCARTFLDTHVTEESETRVK
jgi:hypothetical protein